MCGYRVARRGVKLEETKRRNERKTKGEGRGKGLTTGRIARVILSGGWPGAPGRIPGNQVASFDVYEPRNCVDVKWRGREDLHIGTFGQLTAGRRDGEREAGRRQQKRQRLREGRREGETQTDNESAGTR